MFNISNIKDEITPPRIIIAVILLLFVIVIITEIIGNVFKKTEEIKIEQTNPNAIFFSNDKKVSLEVSKKYELKQESSNEDYLIEVKSASNLNIFVSKRDFIPNKTFAEVVAADKRAFLDEFEATSNISDLTDIKTNNNSGFTYSFQYLDQNTKKVYYLQTIWVEAEDGYYILDIEFPQEYLNLYSSIISDVISGFKIDF